MPVEVTRQKTGATSLMYACQQGKEKDVIKIINAKPGAVLERERSLKTALHYCAESGEGGVKSAQALLETAPKLVSSQDQDGYSPLHLAVIAGNLQLGKLLLAHGAPVNLPDNEGHTPSHWATVCGEIDSLELVLSKGGDPNLGDMHGGCPLHYAAQMCGPGSDMPADRRLGMAALRILLTKGADPNLPDKHGRQPILWAASAGSSEAILVLVNEGASVEAADKDGLTALHCAASRGHTDCIETLISLCNAEVDVIDNNGCSALFYAVTLGHADATQSLLNHGANTNRQDRKGRTAVHCGAAKGQMETLKVVSNWGGNLWQKTVRGDYPLHDAVASGRIALVQWLLSLRLDAVNAPNNDGRCPLHVAAIHNNIEMCKTLLDSGSLVNPVMRTTKGSLATPLDTALHKSHRGCAKYLQLHGGVPSTRLNSESAALRGLNSRFLSTHNEAKNETEESELISTFKENKFLLNQNVARQEISVTGHRPTILQVYVEDDVMIRRMRHQHDASDSSLEERVRHRRRKRRTKRLLEKEKLKKEQESGKHSSSEETDALPDLKPSEPIEFKSSQVQTEIIELIGELVEPNKQEFATGELAPNVHFITAMVHKDPEIKDEFDKDSIDDGCVEQDEADAENEDKNISAKPEQEEEAKIEENDESKEVKETDVQNDLPKSDEETEKEPNENLIPVTVEDTLEDKPNAVEGINEIEKAIEERAVETVESSIPEENEAFASEIEVRETVSETVASEVVAVANDKDIDAELVANDNDIDTEVVANDKGTDAEVVANENEPAEVAVPEVSNENATGEAPDETLKQDGEESLPLNIENNKETTEFQNELNTALETGQILNETFKVLDDGENVISNDKGLIKVLDMPDVNYKEEKRRKSKKRKEGNWRKEKHRESFEVLNLPDGIIDDIYEGYSESTRTPTGNDNHLPDSGIEPSPRRDKSRRAKSSDRSRIPRACRKNLGSAHDDPSTISVTQAVQYSVRKYHLERRIFHQLLELKRLQIRSGRASEAVLVKRLVDDYRRAGLMLGLQQYDGLYTFRSFERYLYEQLRLLQSSEKRLIPRLRSTDDLERLNSALKKTRVGQDILANVPNNPALCTYQTHRCFHATHAYTGIPCAAYITKHNHHTMPKSTTYTGFLPKIVNDENHGEVAKTLRYVDPSRPLTLELSHGPDKQIITLPTENLDKSKRYFVTFTIKSGENKKKHEAKEVEEKQLSS